MDYSDTLTGFYFSINPQEMLPPMYPLSVLASQPFAKFEQ